MKNYDLMWARENAGLTQSEAGEKLHVTDRTFRRWESGAVVMPKRKWKKFLEAIQLDAARIPKRVTGFIDDLIPDMVGFRSLLTEEWSDEDTDRVLNHIYDEMTAALGYEVMENDEEAAKGEARWNAVLHAHDAAVKAARGVQDLV